MTNAPLRGCPLCGTRVSAVALGLRDYRWLGDALPGRVAPMDLDFVLERGGAFLVLEFKPEGAALGMGQRIALKALVRKGFQVWVVRGEGPVEVNTMDKDGDLTRLPYTTVEDLTWLVQRWWEAGA